MTRRHHSTTILISMSCFLVLGGGLLRAQTAAEQTRFPSAPAAFQALVGAARANDRSKLVAILGPDADAVLVSGDEVEDALDRRRFVASAAERTRFETLPDGAVIAQIGRAGTPFAIPMVQDEGRWRFDTPAGKDELLSRRIGRNELLAIAASRAYVDAQREYARDNVAGGDLPQFAQRLRSTPGQRDGLYWDDPSGVRSSPLGPLFAGAAAEGYDLAGAAAGPQSFHGYLFRILTEQGPSAPGGAKSYLVDGKLSRGFALLAWPAEYGQSGIMTFMVGREGVVFQKDLGASTAGVAKAITAYDPDSTWTPTR